MASDLCWRWLVASDLELHAVQLTRVQDENIGNARLRARSLEQRCQDDDTLRVCTTPRGRCLRFWEGRLLAPDNGPLDQSRDRRDGHKAGSVIPTHDHLVVHLIENGAVEPYSLLRYRAGSDGSCRRPTAIAREIAAFLWAIGHQIEPQAL